MPARPILAPLTLALALGAMPLYTALAQDDEAEPRELPGEAEGAGADGEQAAAEPARDDSSSPYDYEATEQISEDRSVSFPVDI